MTHTRTGGARAGGEGHAMAHAAAEGFTRDRAGWIIVALNLLAALNSTMYFTRMLGAGLDGWLAMNSCAPSIFVFAAGYALRQRAVMAIGAGLMIRYGTLGLFVFGWQGMNIIPQIGHILMTLAVAYFIVRMVRIGSAGEVIVALFTAVAMLYAEWQGEWFVRHPGVLKGLMRGTLAPEMFR